MIDLHCHILPGIDDGPRRTEDSIELARAHAREGVRTVVATPHLRDDYPRARPDEVAARCSALGGELRSAGVQLELVPGGEADIVWALKADDDELRLASIGQRGTDLLVETPYGALPPSFEELLFRLNLRRYRILLAHPERNPTFQRDPMRLAGLAQRDVLIQVTAASLAGRPSRSRSARLAHSLVTEGLAHVLASDAHGPEIRGRPGLATALEVGRKLVGGRADWMVTEAPAAVLAGDPLPPMPSAKARK